jgi:maltose alpha-D-glucosyltransferase/alpha-amylase
VPVLVLIDSWASFFPERVAQWRAKAATQLRTQLEERLLPAFIAAQRWFGGKGAGIARAHLADHLEWEFKQCRWMLALIDIESGAERAQYFLPLALVFEDVPESRWLKLQPFSIARVRQQAAVGVLADAAADESFGRAVIESIGAAAELATAHGRLVFAPTAAYAQLRGDPGADLGAGAPLTQGSNTALKCGDRLFLKLYRRLRGGLNPEAEVGRFLTEVAHFSAHRAGGRHGRIPARGRRAGNACAAAGLRHESGRRLGLHRQLSDALSAGSAQRRAAAADVHGAYLAIVRTLATRTAQLHCALATTTDRSRLRRARHQRG